MGTSRQGFFEVLRKQLTLRNYSPRTVKAYRSCLRSFVKYSAPRHPRDLADKDIRVYLLHLIEEERLAPSTINQVINALRFLYVDMYRRPIAIQDIPRPQKERKLPEAPHPLDGGLFRRPTRRRSCSAATGRY